MHRFVMAAKTRKLVGEANFKHGNIENYERIYMDK